MKKLAGVLAALVIGTAVLSGSSQANETEHVIFLHGWTGNASNWTQAKAAYEAAGFTAHALNLPRAGTQAGDTWVNADYVENYIAQNGLSRVQVDGHSLGGTLVYELIRVRRNPAIVSAVTRDSNIHGPATAGLFCWPGLGVPDQCAGSVRNGILSAPLADVPILNVSVAGAALADVDCNLKRDISHANFPADATVTSWAVTWAQGGNPCNPSTPTATTTSAPAPSATATSAFTSTVSPSPTSTPSPTPTPSPETEPSSACHWLLRLLRAC